MSHEQNGRDDIPITNLDVAALENEWKEWEREAARLKKQLALTQQKASKFEKRASVVDTLEVRAAQLQYLLADEQMKVMDLQKERAELNESYLQQYLRADLLEAQVGRDSAEMKELDTNERMRELETSVDKLKFELADEKMKNITLERRITAHYGQQDSILPIGGVLVDDDDSSKNDSVSLEERRLQYQLADEQMRALSLEKETKRETLRADQLQFQLADLQVEHMHQQLERDEVDRLQYQLADEQMKVIETTRRASVTEVMAERLQHELEVERKRFIEKSAYTSLDHPHRIGEDDEDEEFLRIRRLEYSLADEQMRVLELENRRRLSLELLQQTSKQRDALGSQLSQQRAKTLEVDKERRESIKEVYVWRQHSEQLEENLHDAQEELQEAKLKTREVENQRRASISSLSQRMWNKLIEKQTEHDEESIHLARRLQMVEEENARLRKSKMTLILSTSRVIDDLRHHILMLSRRLQQNGT